MPDTGRRVELEGAVNFRDLGGLPVEGGGAVRRGRLFRSDSLHTLTDDDLAVLHDSLRIATVVDLRMDQEVDEHGPREGHFREGVRWWRLPLFAMYLQHWTERESWATEELVAERYFEFVELGAEPLARIVTELGRPGVTPAVVHCAIGRDRTGVVIAMLLDLVGVPRDAIAADFAVTGRYITDFPVTPERILHLLSAVDDRLGSFEQVVRRQGVTDAELTALRAALVDS